MSQDRDSLLEELAAGSSAAFEKLYDRYGERLYGYILGMVRNASQAEDLLQTVMLRFVRYREKFAAVDNLSTYLFVTARNEVIRLFECENRRTDVEIQGEENRWIAKVSPSPDEDDRTEQVRHALERLPIEQAEVISLKIYQDLTFAQIGEMLGISSNTAASRYRYALDKLGRILETTHEAR